MAINAIDTLMGKIYNQELAYELTAQRNRLNCLSYIPFTDAAIEAAEPACPVSCSPHKNRFNRSKGHIRKFLKEHVRRRIFGGTGRNYNPLVPIHYKIPRGNLIPHGRCPTINGNGPFFNLAVCQYHAEYQHAACSGYDDTGQYQRDYGTFKSEA